MTCQKATTRTSTLALICTFEERKFKSGWARYRHILVVQLTYKSTTQNILAWPSSSSGPLPGR